MKAQPMTAPSPPKLTDAQLFRLYDLVLALRATASKATAPQTMAQDYGRRVEAGRR